MKLKFTRQDDAIITKLEIGGEEEEFNYLRFINKLIDGDIFDESEYPEDITEQEKSEIEQMIEKINEVILAQDEDDEAGIVTEEEGWR